MPLKESDIRKFETGAIRDSEENKNDYEGFFHPLVIRVFGDYMTKHRKQSDGKLRASDNWQKGIPLSVYIKSLWRHFLDLWTIHRGYRAEDPFNNATEDREKISIEDACCGIMFNAMGYLAEHLKSIRNQQIDNIALSCSKSQCKCDKAEKIKQSVLCRHMENCSFKDCYHHGPHAEVFSCLTTTCPHVNKKMFCLPTGEDNGK